MEEKTNNTTKQNIIETKEVSHISGFSLVIFLFLIGLPLFIFLGIKALVLFLTSFCIMMWINITLTTIGNALIGRMVDAPGNAFWRILFMILGATGLGVYFVL